MKVKSLYQSPEMELVVLGTADVLDASLAGTFNADGYDETDFVF